LTQQTFILLSKYIIFFTIIFQCTRQ